MRSIACMLLSLTLIGCNEFIQSDDRTTAVDVVGEPADPAPDSMKQADILGSAMPAPEDSITVTEVKARRDSDSSADETQPEPVEAGAESAAAGGLGQARPVSLKSKNPDTAANKPSQP